MRLQPHIMALTAESDRMMRHFGWPEVLLAGLTTAAI
jgi:hypothetical protein